MSDDSTGPLISIVMPFRNEERFLDESLRSIIAQTLHDWELIAVDDHSSDRSATIVRELAAADLRVRLCPNRGTGLVAALNHGLSLAKAPLVARMDADDVMADRRLSLQLEALTSRPDVGLVASRVRLFPRGALRAGYREYEKWQNRVVTPEDVDREIFFESPFAHPSVTIRRSHLDRVGGYRDGPFPEDYELWLRMHAHGIPMMKCEKVLLHWRERPDRASRTDARYERDAFDRLRAHHLARDRRLDGNRPVVVWGAGRKTRARARHLTREGVSIDAWIDIDRRKIGRDLDGARVLAPEELASFVPRPLVLVYVLNHGARELISAHLESIGYELGTDWLPVG